MGCSFPKLNGLYPSWSRGKEVIQNARHHGPPGSVTRDTRDKPADPPAFSFPTRPRLKMREFVSCFEFQKQQPSWSVFVSGLPLEAPSSSFTRHTQSRCLCLGMPSWPAKSPLQIQGPALPGELLRTAFCRPVALPLCSVR